MAPPVRFQVAKSKQSCVFREKTRNGQGKQDLKWISEPEESEVFKVWSCQILKYFVNLATKESREWSQSCRRNSVRSRGHENNWIF